MLYFDPKFAFLSFGSDLLSPWNRRVEEECKGRRDGLADSENRVFAESLESRDLRRARSGKAAGQGIGVF
jgi:hypothetical protein